MPIQDQLPKSRLTLRYKTEVEGELEDRELPFRLLVLGDFSRGNSKDRIMDFDDRRIRNLDGKNTDNQLEDMGIVFQQEVENKLGLTDEGTLKVQIPLEKVGSFSPQNVVRHVAELRKLELIRRLLGQVVSEIDNRKDFRRMLTALMKDEDAKEKLRKELKEFSVPRLLEKKEAAASGEAEKAPDAGKTEASAPEAGDAPPESGDTPPEEEEK